MSWITDFSSSPKGKWIVIAIWLVLAVAIIPTAPMLSDVTTNDSSTFLPDGAESSEVDSLIRERFPRDTTPAIVVFHSAEGLTDEQKAAADQLGRWAQSDNAPDNIDPNSVISIFTVPEAEGGLVSEDGTTMTMVIGVTGDQNSDELLDTITAIREQVDSPPAGLEIAVSGPGGILLDLISVFQQIDVFLTLVTAGLVLVLLMIIYRSPVIAFVPLLSVGWVFMLAGAIAAVGSERLGYLVNGQAQGVMTVLLFGAGTDYCLFISSRFREELQRTEDKHEAMKKTMRAVGGAVASSAGTILIATLILVLATLRTTAALGPLLSIAIGIMFFAALTLVPALMTVLGRKAFWPARIAYDPDVAADAGNAKPGIWDRVASVVTGRPAFFLTASVALFVALSFGLVRFEVTYDQVTSLPEGTEAREGFEILRQSFPAGESAPVEVYAVLPDGTSAYDEIEAIDQLTQALAGYDGVAYAESITAPLGTNGGVNAEQVREALDALPPVVRVAIDEGGGALPPGGEAQQEIPPELQQAIGIYATTRGFVSPDNGVARINVILDASPYDIAQISQIDDIRVFTRDMAQSVGLPGEVLVGGQPATTFDTMQANERDQMLLIPLILLAIALILGVLLRSVIAPLYLTLTIILGYTATLGLSTLLFTFVFGYEGISSALVLYLFVFSAALGIDYSIYLMTRIREETENRDLKEGVETALSRTGGVITSAGIILAGTFSALMTLPLRDLFQIGLAVAIGVLLDTFVTRTIMVPSIVLLLKRWNWWPSARFHEKPVDMGAAAQQSQSS
jgi:putative drug exporter of the RND superfamily